MVAGPKRERMRPNQSAPGMPASVTAAIATPAALGAFTPISRRWNGRLVGIR